MQNKVYAGFFVRLAAYLLDSLIVGVALLLVRIPIAISSWFNPDNIIVRDFIFEYSIADIVLYLLGAAYFVVLTYFTGATLGKKALHLRVVSIEERKVTLFEIIYRETIGRFLSGLVLGVGYLMVGIHKEKHGLHDMLSDTEVVYRHKNVESAESEQEDAVTYAATDYMPENYTCFEKTSEEETVVSDF